MSTIVSCPHCQKKIIWDSKSTWRPFCSERCLTIDLGQWASDEHRISDYEQDEPDSNCLY